MADNILKNIRIKHRSDTEAKWISQNPVLLNGELAISSDKSMYKTGDGTSTWSQLPYNSAVNDSTGQNIHSTYLKKITASGQTLTLTKGDNTTSTISTQDTRNTAGSTNSSSKLFLIGAASQSVNPQTYSRSTCYIGTDGCLYSSGTKVSVVGHSHSYLPLTGGSVSGQVVLSKAADVSGSASSESALIIGSKTGAHLAFDENEIMAKASATTTATLYLNNDGGQVNVGSGGIRSVGEVQSTTANAFRAVQGNYGFFIRNDGSNTYFLLTNKDDQYGGFNSLRPLMVSNSTGSITIGNSAAINGTLTVNGGAKITSGLTIGNGLGYIYTEGSNKNNIYFRCADANGTAQYDNMLDIHNRIRTSLRVTSWNGSTLSLTYG